MNQYFLSFPDEAEAIKQLAKWRGKDEEGNDIWLTSGHDHALYVVGDIFIFPDTPKYGEADFPALKPEIAAKVSMARAELAAAVVMAEPLEGAAAIEAVDIPVMVKSDGFHVNLICAEKDFPESAAAYLVTPSFPKVVWG